MQPQQTSPTACPHKGYSGIYSLGPLFCTSCSVPLLKPCCFPTHHAFEALECFPLLTLPCIL